MSLNRIALAWLAFGGGLIAVNAQPYVISTYAGGAPASPTSAMSLATDASGNVYFVDGYGFSRTSARSNSVFKIDGSGLISRVAGNSRTGFSGDGAAATSASLSSPRGVATDGAGNVFIADTGNQRIRRVSPDGIITTFAGGGIGLGDGGAATAAQLNYPDSIAFDARGNLFLGELGRVRKISSDGVITTVAGGGSNSVVDGQPATSVKLSNAIRVAVDGAGNIFISEQIYDEVIEDFGVRLLKVSVDGKISMLPPVPQCCYGEGEITADAAGNLFVTSATTIWKISPAGVRTAVAGNGNYGLLSGDGQPATRAQLNGPAALAVNALGDLLIADSWGRAIRKVAIDGIIRSVTSIPGSVRSVSGDGGPATGAELQLAVAGLSSQSGLAADSLGNLYIAETGAHRIRKVSPSGTITTVAGVGQARCSGADACLPLGDDGPATSAALSYPTSVAVDSAGNLFIADSSNLRVRKVSTEGIITTVAGDGSAPASLPPASEGLPATHVAVTPFSVAVDGAGNLFISDYASLRKVSPDGTISTALTSNQAFPKFGLITATTVDRAGNLFLAGYNCNDNDNCSLSIRKVSPAGAITVIAATNPSNFQPGSGTGDGGPASGAQLGFISNLAVDFAGNLFLADLHGQRIRKIDVNGIITTVGGNGTPSYSGDGGPGTSATLDYPLGLAADGAGNIYISDFNQAVRILRPAAR